MVVFWMEIPKIIFVLNKWSGAIFSPLADRLLHAGDYASTVRNAGPLHVLGNEKDAGVDVPSDRRTILET